MGYKKYAYYNRGNKVAIVEKESSSGGGNAAIAHCTIGGYSTKDTCEAAGGQWIPGSSSIGSDSYEKYVSPRQDVEDGIEIEYTYTPTYNIGNSIVETNKFFISGWGVDINNRLLLFRSEHTTIRTDWTSSPYSIITTGTSGDHVPGTDDHQGYNRNYIYIEGSSRWNGLHRVSNNTAPNTYGVITTETRVPHVSTELAQPTNGIDISAESDGKALVAANDASNVFLSANINAGDYVFLANSSRPQNNGLWLVDSVDTEGADESNAGIYISNKYYVDIGGDTGAMTTEQVDTSCDTTGDTDRSIIIYKAYRDFCSIVTNIDIMDNETYDIDLTSYQSKAVVYYLKAKIAEDSANIEMREYFMRLFKKQLEKERSARKRGPYILMGNANMRSM